MQIKQHVKIKNKRFTTNNYTCNYMLLFKRTFIYANSNQNKISDKFYLELIHIFDMFQLLA